MSAFRQLAGLVVMAVLFLAGPVGAQDTPGSGTGDEQSFAEVHAAYLADSDLQLERPGLREFTPPRPPEPPPGWLVELGRFLAGVLQFLAPLLKVLVVVGVAGLVLWLAWFLFGDLLRAQFGREKAAKDSAVHSHVEDVRPDAETARTLLEEADALAREGRYAEAVHLLLFRSIEDIQTRRKRFVPRSLTAREIGSLSDLPGRAQEALSPIIAIVERSFFGGREVDSEGWRAARSSYEQFAFGEA